MNADATIASVAISHIDAQYERAAREAWEDLRERLPLLAEEAHTILEHDSECRAEFGMSYVCGGGQVGDVGAAYAQFGHAGERMAMLVAEAERTVRERIDLSISDWEIERIGFPLASAVDPDDIPF